MKYEAKLEKFLKAHGCYSEFMKAIKTKYHESLEEYCDKTDVRLYIKCGIGWDSSKKGFDFWSKLHKEWINGK